MRQHEEGSIPHACQGVNFSRLFSRDFALDDERYTVEIDQTALLKRLLKLAEDLLPVLAARHWSLLVAKDDAADFITSDQPVALVPISKDAPPFLGFGQTCTEVSLPLSRRATLVGHFQGDGGMFVEADSALVAQYNLRTVTVAQRFLFSPEESCAVSVTSRKSPARRRALR